MLISATCGGNNGQAQPTSSASDTSTTTTQPKPAEVAYTLVSVQSGDAACYLNVKDPSGAEQGLPADFELCPGGAADATRYVGSQVTLERRPGQIMADSCAGDPKCTATKPVDLVVAVKPAAASTNGSAPAAVIGQTDTNPAHWVVSSNEKSQRIQQRIYSDDPPTLVSGFPATMNGCATRQLRVRWRSVDSPVAAGITDYSDATTPPPQVRQQQAPALEGSMTLNGCEQPAFRTFTQPSGANLANIVVEVTVFEPAA